MTITTRNSLDSLQTCLKINYSRICWLAILMYFFHRFCHYSLTIRDLFSSWIFIHRLQFFEDILLKIYFGVSSYLRFDPLVIASVRVRTWCHSFGILLRTRTSCVWIPHFFLDPRHLSNPLIPVVFVCVELKVPLRSFRLPIQLLTFSTVYCAPHIGRQCHGCRFCIEPRRTINLRQFLQILFLYCF